jgi:BMFP domain-containing protein YqiC
MCDSPCEHVALILEHEKKLHEIYTNYKQARDEVGLVIKQFEEHKLTIMRVIAYDKQSRRILLKTRKAEHELTQ